MSEWREIDGLEDLLEATCTQSNGWPLRAVALRLADRSFIVFSPLPRQDAVASLAKRGPVTGVVLPNKYHYLGVSAILESFPHVAIVGDDATRKRMTRKRLTVRPLDSISLPEDVEILRPPGLKNGEIWLSHRRRGGIWIVGDAFFSLNSTPGGMTGALLRFTKTAPGLRIGKTWNWMAVKNWEPYRSWLEEKLRDEAPRVLVPAHGEIVQDDDLASRLLYALSKPGAAA